LAGRVPRDCPAAIPIIHYNRNLGDIFTVWDRLFGTCLDPSIERNTKGLDFGIGEKANPCA